MKAETLKKAIEDQLRTVFDPEIPVNIMELGLVYTIDIDEDFNVEIEMTLTAPGCPVADQIVEEVKTKTELVPQVKEANVKIVFEPEWTPDKMSEEAKLELGFF